MVSILLKLKLDTIKTHKVVAHMKKLGQYRRPKLK